MASFDILVFSPVPNIPGNVTGTGGSGAGCALAIRALERAARWRGFVTRRGEYCMSYRKQRVLTPEEQKFLDAVWANPVYTFRAKHLVRSAVLRGAMANGPVEVFEPSFIFERDDWHCKRCGIQTSREAQSLDLPNSPTVDHIVLIRAGGCHTVGNCRCLCLRCNTTKDVQPNKWLALQTKWKLKVDENLLDSNEEIGTQRESVATKFEPATRDAEEKMRVAG